MRPKFIASTLIIVFGLAFVAAAFGQTQPPAKLPRAVFEQAQKVRQLTALRALQQQPQKLNSVQANPERTPMIFSTTTGTGTIEGRLTGLDDAAIPSAWVTAFTVDSAAGRSDVISAVNPDGSYHLVGLAAGEYYVLAIADGYLPTYFKNALTFSDATPVAVKENEVVTGIDFAMEKKTSGTGSIAGMVYRALDKAPISNGSVTVFSHDNPFIYVSVLIGRDGSYRVTGLPSGKYYVEVWADGYLLQYYDNVMSFAAATPVEVIAPNATTGIDFALSSGGVISGVVKDDHGKPLADAYLQAIPARTDSTGPNTYGWALTDATGRYRMGGLASGDYFVYAAASVHWTYASVWYENAARYEDATPIGVEIEKETAGIDLVLPIPVANGTIAGRVTDLQDQPIAGAYVTATSPFDKTGADADGPWLWVYGTTDANGDYRIDFLPDGAYLVNATAYGQWQYVVRWWPNATTPEDAEPVVVNGATDFTPTNFKLPLRSGTATISGTVAADDGRALAGAYISVTDVDTDATGAVVSRADVWANGSTDSTGRYTIKQLPAGAYLVQAQYWEFDRYGQEWYKDADSREKATPVTVTDNEARSDIDFSLTVRPLYGTLFGHVQNEATGDPVARAYVEIMPVWADKSMSIVAPFRFWGQYAVTDDNGDYAIEWLPEGEYRVAVYANGAFEYFEDAIVASQATPVKIVGGEKTEVSFAITPRNEGKGVISGRIYDGESNQPVSIAVVKARPAITILSWPESEKFFTAVTAEDGSYKLSGLPAGEYFLMSFAPYHIEQYYDDVFDPSQATLVKVDETTPTTGIDFHLIAVLYLAADGSVKAPGGGASIFGKITDDTGAGLDDALVYVLDDAGKPLASARTSAEGDYEVAGLSPGRYRLHATRFGYESQYNGAVSTLGDAAPIEVSNGRTEVNFTLSAATTTGVDSGNNLPHTVILYGNYPNPFNPETAIEFGLPQQMRVKVRIFNVLGVEVTTLFDGVLAAGDHRLVWDGKNRNGVPLPSGIYLYRLESTTGTRMARMVLLR